MCALPTSRCPRSAETDGGRLYVPVFYWVDIFAVTQHFSGDFKDHPDSDFPGVIRAAKVGRHAGLLHFSLHTAYLTPAGVW